MPGLMELAMMVAALSHQGVTTEARGSLPEIVTRLELTATGARHWLARLAGGSPAARERLVVATPSGTIVETRDGGEAAVMFGAELERRMDAPGQRLVLVHNHPASSALSVTDLFQLSHRAVDAVAAIGHDGSVYVAVRAAAYDANRFMEEQYETIREDVRERLRIMCDAGMIPRAAADRHVDHLAALALAKARVIDYRADLSPTAAASYGSARRAFDGVAEGAASVLARRSKKRGRI